MGNQDHSGFDSLHVALDVVLLEGESLFVNKKINLWKKEKEKVLKTLHNILLTGLVRQ